MLIPPQLAPGHKVGIVAPARWPEEKALAALCATLERHGLVPVVHPQAREKSVTADGKSGQLAGSDERRAEALNDVLNDASIRAVFFPRGGTGSYRLLDKIDYAALRRDPKIIVGFSDVDALLAVIHQQTGLVTFRGPMGVSFARAADPRTEADCFALLMGRKTNWTFENVQVLQAGDAEGPMLGGNLATLNSLIGTPYDVRTEGGLVVVEDCDELYYRIDRFLFQTSRAGKFATAKAVLFGTLENVLDGEQHDGSGCPFGLGIEAILRTYVPASLPLVMGLPLGHGAYLAAHPLGVPMRFSAQKEGRVTLDLLSPCVA
jgi:muramoyltetrapeptide carboxypeptidase